MKQGTWIQYTVRRSFEEGFVLLVRGPCGANGSKFDAQAQRIVGEWMEVSSGIESLSQPGGMQIPAEQAVALYEKLSAAQINAFPPEVAGLDGETHELVLGGLFNIARFTWFMDLPECWRGLKEPVAELIMLANACLARES